MSVWSSSGVFIYFFRGCDHILKVEKIIEHNQSYWMGLICKGEGGGGELVVFKRGGQLQAASGGALAGRQCLKKLVW